jgi:imidazolonepropionase-like amidohydrolase
MTPRVQVILGATALVGDELAVVEDAAIVIGGGVIRAVGGRADIQIPAEAQVIEARGHTLIPGFIDAHVHIGFYEPSAVVAGGVTTVRDLGWPPARITPLVRASRADDFPGPTIVAAGPMLTAPGGYPARATWAPPGTELEVDSPEGARGAVASVADAGYAIVKIALNPPAGPVLDLDTLIAIVVAAHARSLKVTGHVHGLAELDKALDAGMDELAHMLTSDERIPDATIARMVAAGMVVVPTLSIFTGSPLRTAIGNLHAFKTAGGRIVYGTDLGNAGPRPGIDATEVRAMATAGMTGLDIIRAATVDAAAWLGLGTTGVIEGGRAADLVLIRGDPVRSPEVLTDVVSVWRRGIRAR